MLTGYCFIADLSVLHKPKLLFPTFDMISRPEGGDQGGRKRRAESPSTRFLQIKSVRPSEVRGSQQTFDARDGVVDPCDLSSSNIYPNQTQVSASLGNYNSQISTLVPRMAYSAQANGPSPGTVSAEMGTTRAEVSAATNRDYSILYRTDSFYRHRNRLLRLKDPRRIGGLKKRTQSCFANVQIGIEAQTKPLLISLRIEKSHAMLCFKSTRY